jgi:Flp pilus assembly pilin Flp
MTAESSIIKSMVLKPFLSFFYRLVADKRGVTNVEYGVLLGAGALLLVPAATNINTAMVNTVTASQSVYVQQSQNWWQPPPPPVVDQTLDGTAGNKTLVGGAGNDTFLGGAGDNLNGGAGSNTVSYAQSAGVTVMGGRCRCNPITTGLTINLGNPASNTGDAANTTYTNIQNIIGSSHGDIITGDAGNNVITSGGGQDTFYSSGGNDTFIGHNATLSYQNESGPITVDLAAKTVTKSSGGVDTFTGVNRLIGTTHGDTFNGGSAGASVSGLGITEFGSHNTFNLGTASGLTISDTGGSSLFVVGNKPTDANTTVLFGNGSSDTVSFANLSQGVTYNMTSSLGTGPLAQYVIGAMTNVIGTNFGDTITGVTPYSSVTGGSGNDTISGATNSTLNGGAGVNTLDYSASSAGVNVNLATNTVSGGNAQGDTISNFQNVIGSATGDNVLTGLSLGGSTITGGNGNDTITVTGNSANTINAGNGNNTIVSNSGALDTIHVGSGNNTISLRRSTITSGTNIIGGGTGFNTLNIVSSGSINVPNLTTHLRGIEKINFSSFQTGSLSFDYTDIQTITSNSTGTATLTIGFMPAAMSLTANTPPGGSVVTSGANPTTYTYKDSNGNTLATLLVN